MDPPPPQPPFSDQAAAAAAPPATANPTASSAPPANHPPYDEMIIGAVAGLNEDNGSSKQAIAKYIESKYKDLPPTHAALLAHHLKALKINGQLVMVKHSYKLPTRSTVPANAVAVPPANGAVNTVNNAVNPSDPVPKRRPGRPPKRNLDVQAQPAVPVFAPPANDVNVVAPQDAVGPIGMDNAPVATVPEPVGAVNGPKRGRGRPPKAGGGMARGAGRPPKSGGVGRGRPRGRPPKAVNVVGAAPVAVPGVVPVAGMKRRGRPPKNAAAPAAVGGGGGVGSAGNLGTRKKPRRLSGKPLGRPRKNAPATVSGSTPDSQLLVAYLDLKAKFENLQARIRQTATLIRPCLNNEAALSTLQELEMAGMMNPYAPPPPAPQAQPLAQLQFVQAQQAQVPPQS